MATTSLQPLLNSSKPSHHKTLYLFLSLATILISAAILTKVTLFNLPLQNSLCDHFAIDDKPSCLAMLTNKSSNHVNLLQILLKKSKSQILNSIQEAHHVSHQINDPLNQAALINCQQLMDLSIDRIENSIVALESATFTSYTNAHVWLSTVLTNHVTCLDGLNGSARLTMEPGLKNLISKSRTSLALLVRIISPEKEDPITSLTGDFPSWVKSKERKILQVSGKDIKANVIVAKDGSGNYKSVKEAVASAPNNGKNRYVIYVKKGIYREHVEIGKSKKNVMLVGDGMDSTIITGSLNVVDGSTTFNSATVAAVGDGFIAQDIWFQNTAGPQKHQAVALRVGADKSVINRCRIDAYQDTLYAHSNRQFYRDSLITGTVDFIFGNAAVVFQNCKLVARKPMSGQANMVTAQGRTDPNQNTGTSIQKCDIIASSDLEPVKRSVRSYLGRPWKEFSRTVVLQSNTGDHIDPAGWSIWEGEFALKTLYYGEYMNKGAGAGTSKRVKWAGFHVITSAAEAKKFTVAELIQGGAWLKSTGVAYTEGL